MPHTTPRHHNIFDIVTGMVEEALKYRNMQGQEHEVYNIQGAVNPLNPADMPRIHDQASTTLCALVDNGLLAGPWKDLVQVLRQLQRELMAFRTQVLQTITRTLRTWNCENPAPGDNLRKSKRKDYSRIQVKKVFAPSLSAIDRALEIQLPREGLERDIAMNTRLEHWEATLLAMVFIANLGLFLHQNLKFYLINVYKIWSRILGQNHKQKGEMWETCGLPIIFSLGNSQCKTVVVNHYKISLNIVPGNTGGGHTP